ncbi:hypothetical protein WUBG_15543 [Wuchereria bancrofti]|nr:hypothetical protein WUBG_15543 [Wuchereria bancrofti]
MVAQYGNGTVAGANVTSGQTVSSRTFTDDGRGIVTSTYTAETRYNNVSPARTYEYAKGTMTNLPHDERTATPTMYTEVRAFEIPKSKELTSSVPSDPSDLRAGSHSYLSFLEDSRIPSSRIIDYDTKDRVKSFSQLESGSSFITDSRSYDPKFSSEYHDLDSSSYSVRQYGTGSVESTDQRQTQLQYFGEESMKSDGTKISKNDIDLIKTTSESYSSSMHDAIPSGGYLRNKYDLDQLCSNGYLKHEDELLGTVKGPSFEAPVIASYGRLISDNTTDRQQKASQKIFTPSATVLERSEEMERLPQSWESIEKVDANTACYLKKSVKGGKAEMGENHQHTGAGEQSYRNINAGKDGERCFDLSRPVEESFQTLSR